MLTSVNHLQILDKRRSRLVFFALVALLVIAVGFVSTTTAAQAGPNNDRYIVVFTPGIRALEVAPDVAQEHGLNVASVYSHALNGMVVEVPEGRAAALANDPRVLYIEPDVAISLDAQNTPTGIRRVFADSNTNLDIDGFDDYRVDVDVAVIDTGIDVDHSDLNIVSTINCTTSINNANCSGSGDDDHYHGTHVAGTIAALDNGFGVVGVAPGARLWGVKVLDSNGSGYMSWLIAGVDYVTANANQIDVANMSLGCLDCQSQALDTAITNAVNAGVTFVVSAGNASMDAAYYSPANHPDVITVSAISDFNGQPGAGASPTCYGDQDDTLAGYSNFGLVVDIAAPGTCIYSTKSLEYNGYGVLSGTSMAAPHVAGVAAILASTGQYDPIQIKSALINSGNFNWIDDSNDGIQEPLLDISDSTLFNPMMVSGNGTTGNQAPMVTINTPLDGYTYGSGVGLGLWGEAIDPEEGNVNGSIVWTSDLEGQIGTGGSGTWYPIDGVHTITATATDSQGLIASAVVTITVGSGTSDPEPTPDGFMLEASPFKAKGEVSAILNWTGAKSSNVDIRRNGSIIATTANDGTYIDSTGQKGSPGLTYQVCEAGTSTCSNSVEINGGDPSSGGSTDPEPTPEPTPGGITLAVEGSKNRGYQVASLTWDGATTLDVDVYRDGNLIVTTANEGSFVYQSNDKGGGTHRYQVCEVSSSTCSAVVDITY